MSHIHTCLLYTILPCTPGASWWTPCWSPCPPLRRLARPPGWFPPSALRKLCCNLGVLSCAEAAWACGWKVSIKGCRRIFASLRKLRAKYCQPGSTDADSAPALLLSELASSDSSAFHCCLSMEFLSWKWLLPLLVLCFDQPLIIPLSNVAIEMNVGGHVGSLRTAGRKGWWDETKVSTYFSFMEKRKHSAVIALSVV